MALNDHYPREHRNGKYTSIFLIILFAVNSIIFGSTASWFPLILNLIGLLGAMYIRWCNYIDPDVVYDDHHDGSALD
jgi:hypothetical protein